MLTTQGSVAEPEANMRHIHLSVKKKQSGTC